LGGFLFWLGVAGWLGGVLPTLEGYDDVTRHLPFMPIRLCVDDDMAGRRHSK
jgi:hypothetical protein